PAKPTERTRAMRPNLAERAGSWSAAHWKTATFGWLAFVAVVVALGQLAGTIKLTDAEQATGESARAQSMLASSGFHSTATESVLVQSRSSTFADPAFRRTLDHVVAGLRAMAQVRNLRSPLQGGGGRVSDGGHAALVQFDMRGSSETAEDRVQ